ncbi:hypothetical protein Ancab_030931 [Ancistrocladus abbreviatus]
MNASIKSALFRNPHLEMRAALFHSTPVLDRRRRSHWDTRYNNNNHHCRRSRKQQWKQNILRNVSAYAEQLFQSWQSDFDCDGPPNKGPSWFRRQQWDDESGKERRHNQRRQARKRAERGFQFCDDDVEVENIFQSAFGGDRFFFWSFVNEDNASWRSSSGYANGSRASWNWRYQSDEEYDSSSEYKSSESDLSSERLALGLSPSGPLKLEDVKNAYRVCALKWHPDRHQGPTKGVAEEKFKLCSAAYQSLCDKLAED